MTFNELLAYIVTYAADNPTQRRGQATFNAVYEQCPEIADKARATDIDPFYDDRCIRDFLTFVGNALTNPS
jgi:hypothetical protein